MDGSLDILVSGASIAGPVAAYWLARAGHRVTVVERADQLRRAGQNIDVRGPGREVLRRMGLEEAVLAAGTDEKGIRFVDDQGRTLAEFSAGTDDTGGATAEVEILRGELAKLLVAAGGDDVQYVFGDSIAAMRQDTAGVEVTFAGGLVKRFGLVVLAEGARSRTRATSFTDVVVRDLGLYTAFGTIPRIASDDQWWKWFNTTGGRSINLRPDHLGTTRISLSFLSGPRGYEDLDLPGQRAVLRRHFGDVGWQAPRILDALDAADELYVDYLNQVRLPTWSDGRVVLLGDAAWCATPVSGMGTTLAVTGGYVLAGELQRGNDIVAALRRFESTLRPFVEKAQQLPPGTPRLAHPKTRLGLAVLRRGIRIAGSAPAKRVAGRFSSPDTSRFVLPDYVFGPGGIRD